MTLQEAHAHRRPCRFGAAVAASHAVVPGMIARREGQILNLTSPASYFPLPTWSLYRQPAPHAGPVAVCAKSWNSTASAVSLVCPSKVDTGYFERNDADFRWYAAHVLDVPTLQPERVAREVVQAIRTNRPRAHFSIHFACGGYAVSAGTALTCGCSSCSDCSGRRTRHGAASMSRPDRSTRPAKRARSGGIARTQCARPHCPGTAVGPGPHPAGFVNARQRGSIMLMFGAWRLEGAAGAGGENGQPSP